MYGIGARLDKQPELLFLLRDVDHQELVSQAVAEGNLDRELSGSVDGTLVSEDLGAIFGIELDVIASTSTVARRSPRKAKSTGSTKTKKGKAAGTPESSTKFDQKIGSSRTRSTTKSTSRIASDAKKPATKKQRGTAQRVVTKSPRAAVDASAKRSHPKRSIKKSA